MIEIAVAAIGAAGMLLCQVLVCHKQNSLVLYRLEQLEKKQDKHNDFITKMYQTKSDVARLHERLSNVEDKIH